MFGPFSTRRSAALYLLAWLMLGLVLAALVAGATGAAWTNALLFAVPLTLVYGVAAGFSAFYLCRAFPLAAGRTARIMAVFAAAAICAASVWAGAGLAWNGMWSATGLGVTITPAVKAMLLGLGAVLYSLCAAAHYLQIEQDRARAAERRELESRLMAQEAELRMLRTQVDPHFLFNSLNSISALTSIDPARARQMTLQLSDFFRHSLGLDADTLVTVDDELRLLTDFLAIEQVRFGARLRAEQDIGDEARTCLLPPMLLQPLVENAVKHGIGNLPAGGAVRVLAQRSGSVLRLTVENDIDADAPARKGRGIGLANVRQRLATAYGHEASIHWTREGSRFRVDLTLPVQTKEQ